MNIKIYMYINKINNKKYIGQTRNSLKERAKTDGSGYQKCWVFYEAIKKYGWANFKPVILEDNIKTQEEADEKEKYYIQKYHTYINDSECNGYNISLGGLGHGMTEETKDKIRLSMKDISGENNPFYGCHHTEESIHKISESKKGQGSKSVYCFELNKYYSSIREAALENNIDEGAISAICCHVPHHKSAGKHPITYERLHWIFASELEGKNEILSE